MRLKSAELLRALVGPEETKKRSGRQLARYADVHPSFINHLLAGRRRSCTPQTADRIAEALEVPTEILFEVLQSPSEQLSGKQQAEVTNGSAQHAEPQGVRGGGTRSGPRQGRPNRVSRALQDSVADETPTRRGKAAATRVQGRPSVASNRG
ncbi:helix-turn-helix transcriptional regulator [Mycobacterium sp. PSTR-4-N]|nr:helix-turn-helix transcriptional regulator [Mycobacterium sp. PSTR-4-N]